MKEERKRGREGGMKEKSNGEREEEREEGKKRVRGLKGERSRSPLNLTV